MESNKIIPQFIVNFLLSISFAASFIGIFFFTYGKIVEKQIVIDNVNYTINDLSDFILSLSSSTIKTKLSAQINQVVLPEMNIADNIVENENNILLKQSAKYLGTLLVVSLVISYYICKTYDIDFNELLIQNLILLCGIGLVEFLFLTFVISKYVAANPNLIIKKVLQLIKE